MNYGVKMRLFYKGKDGGKDKLTVAIGGKFYIIGVCRYE